MKASTYPLLFTLLLIASGCKNKTTTEIPDDSNYELTIILEAKSGSKANGKVTFSQVGDTTFMNALLEGLDPGTHAFHLHEKADCSSDDGKSSGGHWNPTAQPHGQWGSEKGYHRGDVGNFTADENGRGTVSFNTTEWCMNCDDLNKNILGKAVIVHQGTDDYTTQPTGDAGGRVSCGGIIE